MFIRPHAQVIINSIKENPEDWDFTEHETGNSKIGIDLWTANGVCFLDLYPSNNNTFNWFEKYAIYKLLGQAEVFASLIKINKTKV